MFSLIPANSALFFFLLFSISFRCLRQQKPRTSLADKTRSLFQVIAERRALAEVDKFISVIYRQFTEYALYKVHKHLTVLCSVLCTIRHPQARGHISTPYMPPLFTLHAGL